MTADADPPPEDESPPDAPASGGGAPRVALADPPAGGGADRDDGAGGDDDDPGVGRWPRGAVFGGLCVLALAVGVFVAASRDVGDTGTSAEPSPTLQPGDTLPSGHPSLDDSDQYESMTLAQLESEVADESAPVALRLTLAERYLSTGDLVPARRQARLARDQAGTDVEQQRALRDLGWIIALQGDAQRGAELLHQAVALDPGERNATWYLANVLLAGLDDPQGAVALLQQLLDSEDLSASQRRAVTERLAAARAAADDDSSSSPPTTAGGA